MSYREYNKEPDFNSYRKNALRSLQQIASETNILQKQKNHIIDPKKNIVIESPQLDSSNSSTLLQQSVILNSIKVDWPNEDDGWIVIKNIKKGDTENGKYLFIIIINKSYLKLFSST